MPLGTLLLLILLILLLATLPLWRRSRRWGYLPGGIIGVILALLIIVILL